MNCGDDVANSGVSVSEYFKVERRRIEAEECELWG